MEQAAFYATFRFLSNQRIRVSAVQSFAQAAAVLDHAAAKVAYRSMLSTRRRLWTRISCSASSPSPSARSCPRRTRRAHPL